MVKERSLKPQQIMPAPATASASRPAGVGHPSYAPSAQFGYVYTQAYQSAPISHMGHLDSYSAPRVGQPAYALDVPVYAYGQPGMLDWQPAPHRPQMVPLYPQQQYSPMPTPYRSAPQQYVSPVYHATPYAYDSRPPPPVPVNYPAVHFHNPAEAPFRYEIVQPQYQARQPIRIVEVEHQPLAIPVSAFGPPQRMGVVPQAAPYPVRSTPISQTASTPSFFGTLPVKNLPRSITEHSLSRKNYLNFEGRRLVHNVSERRRRNSIKAGFYELRERLPNLSQEKQSKIEILKHCAMCYE